MKMKFQINTIATIYALIFLMIIYIKPEFLINKYVGLPFVLFTYYLVYKLIKINKTK
jgi:hypothetical protein